MQKLQIICYETTEVKSSVDKCPDTSREKSFLRNLFTEGVKPLLVKCIH